MAYKRPLLREMIAEIFLSEDSLPQSKFMRLGHLLTEAGFPQAEIGQVDSIKISPGLPIPERRSVPRIRMWNTERNKLIQYSPDEFYVNLVGPYLGWSVFCELTTAAEKAVQEVSGKPLAIRQVALVALDAMTLHAEGFRLGQYLNCGGKFIPSWYREAAEAADISLGRGLIAEDKFNQSFQFSIRPQGASVAVEFQSSFRTSQHDSRSLSEILDALHDESISAFEEIITQKTRDEVMGGRK